ncbi:MAG: hypothetical protein JKY52_13250 [Flavobacteriales bacterium]|nr:hypothetical protein [Flavobacteriales bacterium]
MGSKSAVIRVDANRKVYFGATSGQQFTLPLGLPTYLELHYASNIELSVGAIKNTIQGPETLPAFLNLFPSNEWNKVYIDLTDYLKTHTDALSFEIYFFCSFNANVPNNRILLDNIKLIHQ